MVRQGLNAVIAMAAALYATVGVESAAFASATSLLLNSPAFPPLPLPATSSVVVQLKTSLGTCWGATFSTPTVNTATKFRARSD
jgi:hypothetical protein